MPKKSSVFRIISKPLLHDLFHSTLLTINHATIDPNTLFSSLVVLLTHAECALFSFTSRISYMLFSLSRFFFLCDKYQICPLLSNLLQLNLGLCEVFLDSLWQISTSFPELHTFGRYIFARYDRLII